MVATIQHTFKTSKQQTHFNDSFVKKIELTDLVDAFGFSDTPKNRRLAANHQNAYMLLYRLINENTEQT
jgi:hypothetical protein